ncbi:MAG: hypothetical protein ACHREM_27025, partial [Polyangiales bacterium]
MAPVADRLRKAVADIRAMPIRDDGALVPPEAAPYLPCPESPDGSALSSASARRQRRKEVHVDEFEGEGHARRPR